MRNITDKRFGENKKKLQVKALLPKSCLVRNTEE